MQMIVGQLLTAFLKAIDLYTMALVVYALLSWFPGGYQSSIGRFLARICEPYLSIFDRLNLNIGGISFSIMIGIMVLNFGSRVLVKLIIGIF